MLILHKLQIRLDTKNAPKKQFLILLCIYLAIFSCGKIRIDI
jgi:hypothetical protein